MEVAGLAIGGIGLLTLFDQCLNLMKYIETAKRSSSEHHDCFLMLELYRRRIDEWQKSARNATNLQLTPEDEQLAKDCLKQISARLGEAVLLIRRYVKHPEEKETTVKTNQADSKAVMISQSPTRYKSASRGLSVMAKARWALLDNEKINALIAKVEKFIISLEQLLGAAQGGVRPGKSNQQQQPEMMCPARDDKLHADNTSVQTSSVVPSSTEGTVINMPSHSYRQIQTRDRGLVYTGDYYSTDWKGPIGSGGRNIYDEITVSDNSIVLMGTMFGGQNVFQLSRS